MMENGESNIQDERKIKGTKSLRNNVIYDISRRKGAYKVVCKKKKNSGNMGKRQS